MNKIVALILAVLYFTTTSGMVINIHYCMGEVFSVEINKSAKEECNKCGAKSKSGCCNTQLKIVKLNEVHQPVTVNTNTSPASIEVASLVTTNFIVYNTVLDKEGDDNSPPILSPPDIFIKNCVFLV